MNWRYGTTVGAVLSAGQVLRGAESGTVVWLVGRSCRPSGWGWEVRTLDGRRDWVSDWQMQYFEPEGKKEKEESP